MREYTIVTDLMKQVTYTPPVYVQNDSLQYLNIEIQLDGKPFPLTEYTPMVFFKIPDKPQPIEQRDGTISGANNNIVEIELDGYILSEPGTIYFEVELHKDAEITTTFRLQFVVQESFDVDEALESQPNWDIINRLATVTPENYVTREEYESAMVDVDSGLPVDLTLYVRRSDLKQISFTGRYDDIDNAPIYLSQFVNDIGLGGGGSGGGSTSDVWFKVITTNTEVPIFTDKYILNTLANLPDKSILIRMLSQEVLDYIGTNGGGTGGGNLVDGGTFLNAYDGGAFTDSTFTDTIDGGAF